MEINTNLNCTFRKLDDLLRYMQEEKIEDVEVTINYWGAKFPTEKLTINEVEKRIQELNNIDK